MIQHPASVLVRSADRTPRSTFGRTERAVLVIDDHLLFAESLTFALRLQGVSRVLLTDRHLEASQLTEQIRRDDVAVVILDPPMAGDPIGANVIDACRAAHARVLVVTGPRHPELVAEALLAGAEAVMNKARPFDELVRDLVNMIAGADPRPPQRPNLRVALVQRASHRGALESLSLRESQVLGCLMDGRTVDEIAGRASISVATVRSHVHAILAKLEVNSQLAAVAVAHRSGWTADSRRGGAFADHAP